MTASIVDALDNPALFASHFRGSSWLAWRAFLKALFALPMTAEELAIFQAQTGRTTAPTLAFVEAALIVGRRGGKSRVLALIAVFLACFRDYDEHLAPGELATVAVIASDRRQARSIFRYISGLLSVVPALAAMVADETQEAITLTNKVQIEIGTASFRVVRGYSFAAVLCDEIAFWRQDESSANPDVEILRALRPGMATIPGSVLLLASSPYAKRGELYQTFRRHYGRDDARTLVWKADTATMNPRVDPAVIADAYEKDPESARAEFGAEFRDDLQDFVSQETVDAVTCWGRYELPPEPGVQYYAFCDPSGGNNDAMTLAIAHLRDGSICVLDVVLEVRPQPKFDPESVVWEFSATLRRYGVSRVIGDRYAGEWPRARFRESGILFEQSAKPKSDLYHDLLPLLNAKRVELLDSPRLRAQLVGLERRTARSGRDSIDHVPGGHDDVANAVAGALVGLDLDRRPALARAENLLKDGAPLPMPTNVDQIVAILAVATNGHAATLYGTRCNGYGTPLTFVDFDVEPFDGNTFAKIDFKLRQIGRTFRVHPRLFAFVPGPLRYQAHAAGLPAAGIPACIADTSGLALSAAGHIASGKVKMTATVFEKARTNPWGSALEFRAGDHSEDPLRIAALQMIVASLEEERVLNEMHAASR